MTSEALAAPDRVERDAKEVFTCAFVPQRFVGRI
jgi:hypothetical protein